MRKTGWYVQRHLYAKCGCSLCHIEVLLLDLVFMCDWKGVPALRLWQLWPALQSPDDTYCHTAVGFKWQWTASPTDFRCNFRPVLPLAKVLHLFRSCL